MYMSFRFLLPRLLVVIGITAFLLLAVPAQAQTIEDTYEESLLELISVLQQQIKLLQAQLDAQTDAATRRVSRDGLLAGIEGTLVASYPVTDMDISDNAPRAYREYVDRMDELLPRQYDSFVTELIVYTDGDPDIAAYVETTIPYQSEWTYAIREEEIIEDPESDASTELLIHEFAHVFSLDEVFQDTASARTCLDYFGAEICYPNKSILGEFVTEYWDEDILDDLILAQAGDELTQAEFYNRYELEFVTEYAATDPSEDFAESFAWYVFGDLAPRGSVADAKIEFFDDFVRMRTLAEVLRSNI